MSPSHFEHFVRKLGSSIQNTRLIFKTTLCRDLIKAVVVFRTSGERYFLSSECH